MCLIEGRQKLIYTYRADRPRVELYHLGEDPAEKRSRARDFPKRAEKLRAKALARFKGGQAMAPGATGVVELSKEQEEHLRALGYVE
jgi:hypothetical protein